MSGLKQRVASGSAINAITQIVRVVTQFFIVLPILTRILSPAEYGIVAMSMSVILVFYVFNDLGIGSALVRSEESTPGLWASAFVATIAAGAVLAGLAFIGADVLAAFFSEPDVADVSRAFALVLFI
ncbi:MAG: oligosaccharide flippase family protein, partial [Pseudomonadota bacterium]